MKILPSKNGNETSSNGIVWEDCDDVYRPIKEEFVIFTQKHSLPPHFCSAYIAEIAIASLRCHLESDLKVEQGGILFGNAYIDSKLGAYVEIIEAIAAPATIASSTYLKFTANSWQGIMAYAKELAPGSQIVGWYHSHPDLGVFMSSVDMRTHQAFFPHSWNLSIVYDPVKKEIGYFQGLKAKKVKPTIFSTWTKG
ncbi:Mov34/MPN/PAD-1 family protein [Cyanobacteria bacterium FACHB-471]|nr:Mov34/MPN/PAD-1 family protein [Cyanobacteria bacterium FACHB-471]